jgi:hypothetical protein
MEPTKPNLKAARRELLRRGKKYQGVELFQKKPMGEWRKVAAEFYGEDMKVADTKDEMDTIIICVIESFSKHADDFQLDTVENNLDHKAYQYRFYTDVAYAYPQLRDTATRWKKRCIEMAADNLDEAGLPKIVPYDYFGL